MSDSNQRGFDARGRPTTWPGGVVRYDRNGKPVYVIRRMKNGRRWKKALDVRTRHDAVVELAKFDIDPEGYCTEANDDEPIYLDDALVQRFLAWSGAPKADNGKQNTVKWRRWQKKCLLWWAERLVDARGRLLDLRRVNRAKHILPHLDGVPGKAPGSWVIEPTKSKRHKREVIKALYSWLRKHEGRLTAAQDPVMDMPVGQGRVAQTEGGKVKVVAVDHVKKVIAYLAAKGSRYAHVLTVQAGTGWHTTEMVRFVADGRIEEVPVGAEEPGIVAVLFCPHHKNGKPHRTKVREGVLASARILLDKADAGETEALDGRSAYYRGAGEEAGAFSYRHYVEAVNAACKKLGIPRFSGAWMRHTNATHALQQRFGPDEVGKFLGHADGSMVAKVYGVNAVPPKVPSIMDEPPGLAASLDPRQERAVLLEKLAKLEAELAATKREVARNDVPAEPAVPAEVTGTVVPLRKRSDGAR